MIVVTNRIPVAAGQRGRVRGAVPGPGVFEMHEVIQRVDVGQA